MKTKPNFEKASVSLPTEVHEWLKAEAQRRTELYGESWSVSRIVQEALREYRTRANAGAVIGQAMPDRVGLNETSGNVPAPPHSRGSVIVEPSETSVGGSLTRRTTTYRKTGKAK